MFHYNESVYWLLESIITQVQTKDFLVRKNLRFVTMNPKPYSFSFFSRL